MTMTEGDKERPQPQRDFALAIVRAFEKSRPVMLGVSDLGDADTTRERMRPIIIIVGSALGVNTGRLLVNSSKVPLANV